MAIIHGEQIIIADDSAGSPIIALAKSCVIEEDCELIETASGSSQNKCYRSGREDWTVTVNHLVSGNATLSLLGGTYKLYVVVNGSMLSGNAICQHCNLSAPIHALATGVVTFKGIEPLGAVSPSE